MSVVSSAVPVTWTEERTGIIQITMPTILMSGKGWLAHLHARDVRFTPEAESMIVTATPRTLGKGIEAVIINRPCARVAYKAHTYAWSRGHTVPNPDVACMVRHCFEDAQIEKMGLRTIVVMHHPITDRDGHRSILCVTRNDGGRCMASYPAGIAYEFQDSDGLLFLRKVIV